jgi:hypothetical protein
MKDALSGDENISKGARLHRVLAKDPINPAGIHKKKTSGKHTMMRKETLEVLLQTHFQSQM